MEIIDNFLEKKEFYNLQNLLVSKSFPWYYLPFVDYVNDVDKFQFNHEFFCSRPLIVSTFSNYVFPIEKKLDPLSILRIKANLLTRTSNIIKNEFHTDIADFPNFPEKLKQWTTSIFYVNTNNGYTEFEDGTKIESVANRMVVFSANMKHRGTSCTDEKTRIVINFNYFT